MAGTLDALPCLPPGSEQSTPMASGVEEVAAAPGGHVPYGRMASSMPVRHSIDPSAHRVFHKDGQPFHVHGKSAVASFDTASRSEQIA